MGRPRCGSDLRATDRIVRPVEEGHGDRSGVENRLVRSANPSTKDDNQIVVVELRGGKARGEEIDGLRQRSGGIPISKEVVGP
ncbi:MAG: hypothetical protein ACK5N9_25520, partial [Pirellula sp.]